MTDPGGLFASPLPTRFARRVVTMAPGEVRPSVEADWRDALVVVEQGALELECRGDRWQHVRQGDVLWLAGVPVVALHNLGAVTAVLVAIRRAGPSGA
jgi:quercetin dioxygenase-like cupin family protein